MESIKERNRRRFRETKKVTLTSVQSRFFSLVMKAASEDKELAQFLRTPASGKSFVMEQIYIVLNAENQIVSGNRNVR